MITISGKTWRTEFSKWRTFEAAARPNRYWQRLASGFSVEMTMTDTTIEPEVYDQWKPVKHDARMMKLVGYKGTASEIEYWSAVYEAAKHQGCGPTQLATLSLLVAGAVAKRMEET
jgi:hypothetical protein